MEHINAKENDLFVKALRLLWERRFAMEGWEADINPTLVKPEKPASAKVA